MAHDRRRLTTAAAAALGGLIVLAPLIDLGVVPVAFAATGDNYRMSVDDLTGENFAMYATSDTGAVAVLDNATAARVCQSRRVGPVVWRATAGTPGHRVRITNLVLDAQQLDGADLTMTGAETSGLRPVEPNRGLFGMSAAAVRVSHYAQTGTATNTGWMSMPGTDVRMGVDVAEC
ncbi:DUF6230 family protein [Longispora fulva]|uniref:Cholesterol esterase n=1 Tax=Longispora fulva TaxID=619741 RepID=A0A8J7KNK5_9ACTN|nr:DUF6230 family protein [Longispora fulva]MBG6135342.1 hypothetical protein [Longispora fulva]